MSNYWTRSKIPNAEDESATAAKVLEEMYSGTFTVEVGEYEMASSPALTHHDGSSEDWEVPSVKNLCIDEIAQAIGADNEHLKDIFGGKVPTSLLQQLADHLNATEEKPKPIECKPKPRKRRMPSLEKLDKISRPPNSFMVFAQEFRPKLSQENPDYKNKEISVMLGNMWHRLSEPARNAYEERAREIAAEHKRKNPWYVYNPQEARIRKAQRDQTKQALRAARQRKNSGHAEREGSPPHMMRHPCLPRNGPGMMPPFGAHPHKVFHGSAAAAVSANEMRGHGGPAVHAYGASPPPQRFYPAPYVDHNAYSMQYSSHHQLPAGWFSQQPQYHPQHHHQMQPNGGFGNRSHGREVPYMNSHYLPHHQQPHTPQQHQLLGPNNEPEDVTPMPQHLLTSQYEVEGTVPPTPASSTPSTEGKKENEEKKSSSVDTENPDSQPLPPFQHAFGSTEIGRFAHEGFSAQGPVEVEFEIVEMDGEVSYEGESYVIECSVPSSSDDSSEKENTAETP